MGFGDVKSNVTKTQRGRRSRRVLPLRKRMRQLAQPGSKPRTRPASVSRIVNTENRSMANCGAMAGIRY